MLISEIYRSRQGEGLLTGTPSVFVRTSGCNLRCSFCDTPFASWEPDGTHLTVRQIVQQIHSSAEDARHVVLTGGEPMLPREINELCQEIHDSEFHITIETAGTIHRELPCDLMSVSPKLSNSDPAENRAGEWRKKHQSARYRPEIVDQLIQQYEFQLKFVVDSPADLDEILRYLDRLGPVDPVRVMLMPQGVNQVELEKRAQWLKPLCNVSGFTYCPRKHIQWYGNKRGT
jgi:7-carboxy-7-deazaguanine synthase